MFWVSHGHDYFQASFMWWKCVSGGSSCRTVGLLLAEIDAWPGLVPHFYCCVYTRFVFRKQIEKTCFISDVSLKCLVCLPRHLLLI